MKKIILATMMTALTFSIAHASLGETPKDVLARTVQNQKIVFFAETPDVRFKTVGLPFLEMLKGAGFDCLAVESESLKTGYTIPTGLTYENYELLYWLGFFKNDAQEIKQDLAFIQAVKSLGYKLSNYQKSTAASQLANMVNTRECQRVVAIVKAKGSFSLPSPTVAQSLTKSGWDTVSFLLMSKEKSPNKNQSEYDAVFTF